MMMIYKKLIFIFSLTLFFVFAVNAMPPHPSNKNPSGRERTENIDSMGEPLYKSIMRSSPSLRASGFSGTMNVLVILADFGADLAEQPTIVAPLTENNNPFNKSGYLIPSLLLIFLIIQILFKNRKRYIFLNAWLLVMLSCSEDGISIKRNNDPGDPLAFTTPNSVYEKILDTNPNPSFLTMKKYYQDMSNNNLILNFDIVGPVTVSKGWQYYGRNSVLDMDNYPAQFVTEAVKLAKESGKVTNFAKYDNNNDGYVDTVIIIHAGPGEEIQDNDTDTIWSHSWDLNSAKRYGDGNGAFPPDGKFGKLVNRYTIQPEYNISSGDSTIGVFCHEFAHVLGLPDLYDTSHATSGVGDWSLMSAGSWGSGNGEDPAPLLAWERYDIGGSDWVTIEERSKTTQSITGISDIETGRKAYKIPLNDAKTQYLLLERKTAATGTGKKNVPASGILITHINETIIENYKRSNTINNGKTRAHGVNIVEAIMGLGVTKEEVEYGKGVLWKGRTTHVSAYGDMIFTSGGKINVETPSIPAPYYQNSKYYTSENVTSKTGYSGIEITVSSESSVNIKYIAPTP